jgi:hypothetical protein
MTLLCFLLLLAAGCRPDDSSTKQEGPQDAAAKAAHDKWAAEMQSLGDPSRGAPDFIKRLRDIVKVREGILIVNDPLAIGAAALSRG